MYRCLGRLNPPLEEKELHSLRVDNEECLLRLSLQLDKLLELGPACLEAVVALRHHAIAIEAQIRHQSRCQVNRRDGDEKVIPLLSNQSVVGVASVAREVVEAKEGEDATGAEVCARIFTLEANTTPAFSLHAGVSHLPLIFRESALEKVTKHSLMVRIFFAIVGDELPFEFCIALKLYTNISPH